MVQGGMQLSQLIKYLLFLFNFCFVIIGAVLLGVGVSTKAGWNEKYLAFIHVNEFAAPPNLLIAVGCLIFIIAFLGCCGAYKENHCMIMTYSVLVGFILVLELGAAFAAFALKDDVHSMLEDGLTKTQKLYGQNNTEGIEATKSWDALQSSLHCCGTNNFTDWGNILKHNDPTVRFDIPTSCCHDDTVICSLGITTDMDPDKAAKTIYVDGCLQKAIDDFAVGTLGVIALVLAGIELLGVLCACFLARSVRYSYETV